ncbi:MAG: F0F1 ATP synthase subunit A [Bacteroidales bacterium]
MGKKINKRPHVFRNLLLMAGIAIFVSAQVLALGKKPQHHDSDEKEWIDEVVHEKFKAGDLIMEHVVDAHEWHILSYHDFHLVIPLPVILWYEGELHVFMSGKFHHGHNDYKGFGIAAEGKHHGKIVRTLQNRFITDGVIVHDETKDLPLDFSITKNVLAIFISVIFMSWLFIYIAKMYRRRNGEAPKGIQSLLEPLIIFIRDDIAKNSIGEDKYQRYLPFLLTLFFFIFINNLLGLVPVFPGGANVTGNITVTMVLALFTFFISTFTANKNYWQHIFNTPGVPWWLKYPVPLMPVVEFVGMLTKPFVLMVRLFANITAGHIILLGFISLIFIFGEIATGLGYGVSVVSIAFAIFMNLLELLVAFIQAYVFTLLSALYFGMATEEHH